MRLSKSCVKMRNSIELRLVTVLLVITSMVLTIVGCNTTGCTDNRSSLPLAGFYDAGTGAKISLDSIDVGGVDAPGDSLLLYAGAKASEVYLPFRSEFTATSFFIAYRYKSLDNSRFNDTISFGYTVFPYFASEECGAMMRYKITSVSYTRHLLDSVGVVADDSLITNVPVQNLHLYFKTSSAEAQ